jgi:hypothetical protein
VTSTTVQVPERRISRVPLIHKPPSAKRLTRRVEKCVALKKRPLEGEAVDSAPDGR